MKVKIDPSQLHGSIKAIASKSQAHRTLICAAFADGPTDIYCRELSLDIEATAGCLKAMGSNISYDRDEGVFHVEPYDCEAAKTGADAEGFITIDVGESGSTLRFLLPIVCALGLKTHIIMHGRLPERPLSPLWEELEAHGAILSKNADGTIDVSGALCGSEFTIAADISSQFISGLLFAIPLIKNKKTDAVLTLTGNIESGNYILMTIKALELFGVKVDRNKDKLRISKDAGFVSAGTAEVEGDWSNGAFWIAASAMTKGELTVTGLDPGSPQGDRAAAELKERILAGGDGQVTHIDARDVPDLVPVLSVLAAAVNGETVFEHAERLRIKESDRIKTTVELLKNLGADADETADGIRVRGTGRLRGGDVDSHNDHRIAMSAAVASIICENEVTVSGAEAVRKSYPDFWKDFEALGGRITEL
ncbi:MAG: 3-phosphoshikimate 1-carboxyvinyltransferase [Eubacteriales bacterium]|nr:3-phosphoshikimate 1-carboxyvinyltransferase [Eubacteriales bacterium]